MSTDDDAGPVIRPFADFLRENGKGKTHEQLSESLHELIARVQDTGKKGSITYTLVIEPLKKADGVYKVDDRVQTKFPEHDRRTSMFFIDGNGNFTRSDPNQLEFEGMRALPDPAEERAEARQIRKENHSS